MNKINKFRLNKSIKSFLGYGFIALVVVVSVLTINSGALGYNYGTSYTTYNVPFISSITRPTSYRFFEKSIILTKINKYIDMSQQRLDSALFDNLSFIPATLRAKLISADLNIANSFGVLKSTIETKELDEDIYNEVSSFEVQNNFEYLWRIQQQNLLLLKNYNRFLQVIQNSYEAINDTLFYIDIHNSNSDGYFGLSYFSDTVYNNQILPLESQLEDLKTNSLDPLYDDISAKIAELESANFGGSSGVDRSAVAYLEEKVNSMLNVDFPVYKIEYQDEIKNDIVAKVSQVLDISEDDNNLIAAASINCPETVNDTDGNVYNVAEIGSQCWIASNMRVGNIISYASEPDPSNGLIERWCYYGQTANCTSDGGLYRWDEAMQGSVNEGAQGICPSDWHIPTDKELNILEKYAVYYTSSLNPQYPCLIDNDLYIQNRCGDVSGGLGAGRTLKDEVVLGDDLLSFSATFSGYRARSNSSYNRENGLAIWSSSRVLFDTSKSWYRHFYKQQHTVYRSGGPTSFGLAVRCIKDQNSTINYSAGANGSISGNTQQTFNAVDVSGTAVEAVADSDYKFVQWSDGSTENPRIDSSVFRDLNLVAEFESVCPTATISDIDGNIYNTVGIGNQCWMTENIKVGTMLASGSTEPTSDAIIEKWCYDNSSANCDEYGGLYNWNEAMRGSEVAGAQGICPSGWHIPTDAEWNILENTVMSIMGGTDTCNLSTTGCWQCSPAGQALKANRSNYNGTDAVGFNGLLSGLRDTSGSFDGLPARGYYWSSTPSTTSAWRRYLSSSFSSVRRAPYSKLHGFSIRCLKD